MIRRYRILRNSEGQSPNGNLHDAQESKNGRLKLVVEMMGMTLHVILFTSSFCLHCLLRELHLAFHYDQMTKTLHHEG